MLGFETKFQTAPRTRSQYYSFGSAGSAALIRAEASGFIYYKGFYGACDMTPLQAALLFDSPLAQGLPSLDSGG